MVAHLKRRSQLSPDVRLSQLVDRKIADRLHGFGIETTRDWLALSQEQKSGFFGLPKAMVAAVELAVSGLKQGLP
jgi:hypothetical protein